jgi:hypothetical protein
MLALEPQTDFFSRREVEYLIVRQDQEAIGNELVRTAVHTHVWCKNAARHNWLIRWRSATGGRKNFV